MLSKRVNGKSQLNVITDPHEYAATPYAVGELCAAGDEYYGLFSNDKGIVYRGSGQLCAAGKLSAVASIPDACLSSRQLDAPGREYVVPVCVRE